MKPDKAMNISDVGSAMEMLMVRNKYGSSSFSSSLTAVHWGLVLVLIKIGREAMKKAVNNVC